MLTIILLLIASYLLGAIPFGLWIGKIFFKKNLHDYGSGNTGTTNTVRILGVKAGISVFAFDLLKGTLATLLPLFFHINGVSPLIFGLLAVIGHTFSIFDRFKGGKAVATSFGFFLGIATFINHQYFFQFFLPLLIFLVSLYLCRMVSLSSIIGLGSGILISFLIGNPLSITLSIFVLWLFVVYRHHANIERIKNGTESKIKWMGKSLWEK